MWALDAALSALFAGLTSILAKLGVRSTDSDVATALRTAIVLVLAWVVSALSGTVSGIGAIPASAWGFLIASGAATGASWICYFHALAKGPVSAVTPIDKASTPLTVILAFLLLGESASPLKILALVAYFAGALLMLPAAQPSDPGVAPPSEPHGGPFNSGLPWEFGSAVLAALNSILGKVGVEGVPSDLATAIRTCVVVVLAFAIVIGRGKWRFVRAIDRRELGFLIASGLATGASWLFFYRALRIGPAHGVVPIDKLSFLVSLVFARVVLGEHLSSRARAGLVLAVASTVALAL
ncbi:EamA family transporter [Schaalia hyovaginalis]|uniref:EamA family transporter n=1 Tax=Schaalia hyovaginalis TaxID=29316 RepID=UPI0026EBA1A4|nr:EamA family transporter [Schaalia hyovaginalis]MCI6410991.1 EamA family transporter [Schaalia hyovaginalis]